MRFIRWGAGLGSAPFLSCFRGKLFPAEENEVPFHPAYQGFDKKMHLTYNHHVDIDFNPRVFKGRAECSWAGDGVPKEVV